MSVTANATFCATLVDEWIRAGLTAAFIAPGSRSTPLALALTDRPEIQPNVFHDERSAAFAALGHGLAAGTPAVVTCTSGTAAAHFHAAVVEADLSCVPLLVATADRPPELWDVGAPQAIDQTELYGGAVRRFIQPGPPDDSDPAGWRNMARDAFAVAAGGPPGPVHLNLSFRDPLTGTPGPLPPVLAPAGSAMPQPAGASSLGAGPDGDRVAAKMVGRRGVIIAGRGESDPDDVLALAAALGWPVIADHRSGCRRPGVGIRHFDALLRQPEFVAANRPDVILRLGEIMSSKAVSQWLTATDAVVVSAMPWGRTIDPEGVADTIVPEAGLVRQLLAALHSPVDDGLAAAWADADRRAATAIDAVLAEEPGSEVAITRAAMNAVPAGGALVLSSSMPVRDAEWYGPNRDDIDVYSNRGANGIDGVISTAIGIALGGRPTICLLGDVALLHDSNGLIGLAERDVDLTIVVIDNDGGGIFSFLPQHELLDDDRYELLFGTPHGVDLIALATAVGVEAAPFDPAAVPPAGARVLVARSDRAANLELHNRLNTAVGDAIRG